MVHPKLLELENSQYSKAIIFAKGLIITIFFDLLYSFYFYFHNPTDNKNISNIIGFSTLIIASLLLRFQPNLKLTFVFVASCILPLIAWGVSFTGGIYSTNLIWFLVISINVYIYIGRKVGIYFSIACFAIYVIFLFSAYLPNYNQYYLSFLQTQDPADSFFNIAFSSLFCFVIIFFFVKSLDEINEKIKKVNEEKVATLNQKIKEKTSELSSLRANLARDFHDEMGNKLAGINVLSQMLAKKFEKSEDAGVLEALETIQQRSNELFIGTKDFIWSIDFKSDYVLHLIQYIQDFGEDFFYKLNINFQIQISSDITVNDVLEITSGRHILSIFKEAMTNIAKHSHALNVVMTVQKMDNELHLSIEDDGEGFNLASTKVNGINNMKDRAKLIGATFRIDSSSNSGTRISLITKLTAR
jgi:signal transduction histidine kinase